MIIKAPATHITEELIALLDADQANRYRIIPYQYENNCYEFYSDVIDNAKKEELELFLQAEVHFLSAEPQWITTQLSMHYRKASNSTFDVKADFLERLINEAQALGCSDIHVEPLETRGRVRLRLDGKLIERFRIDLNDYAGLVNKIKVKANLDISEKRLPQDGRISIAELEIDLRVSVLPLLKGEKVVLRILSKTAGQMDLLSLGFDISQLNSFEKALLKPYGIILISGPTGSGKTTTLYATLKKLKDISRNIMTIEDPVECTMDGISQVQVREEIGLDFPTALKSFLRQDPDIIMIGEIRDLATAKMAIRASLTGHLVFSTIHTNNAWDTLTRLQDMGIPPFLVANTMQISVAQRLVRKLCPECKTEKQSDLTGNLSEEQELLNQSTHIAIGCTSCHFSGYKGRQAIYEVMPITEQIREDLKSNHVSKREVYATLNIKTLQQQAMELVKTGVTSFEEVQAYFIE